jgi:RNA polymerase sigma-70 factor (ECF subfamily)
MVNTALEKHRKKNLMYPVAELYTVSKNMKTDDIESNISAQELMGLIQKLSPGYRTVFNLYAIEGYSHQEISERLGISEGTSKSQLARARNVLQEEVFKLYQLSKKKRIS